MNPDTSSQRIVEKILYRIDGDIRNAVKVITQQDATWDKFVEVFSEVWKVTTVIRRPVSTHIPRKNIYQIQPFTRDPRPPAVAILTHTLAVYFMSSHIMLLQQ